MEQYEPPFHISYSMLKAVASISEKIGEINIRNDFEVKPHLRRHNLIQSIHSSLKIEANSLSMDQVRDVIDGRPVIGEPKEIQEVQNAYAAYRKLSDINPYSLRDLKEIHGIMTKDIVQESGVFRSGEEGVFNGEQCIFMAPPARMVPGLMFDLFDWMQREKETIHPLILSSVFHYEFVFIHPFADGNGRMARLWHTALLYQWKSVFAYIPLESQIEKFQEEYYDVIAFCNKAGNSDAFIEFMLTQIDQILAEILEREEAERSLQGKKEDRETRGTESEYVRRLLDVMETDIPYTTRVLMEKLGLKSRETFRKHYLNPAMEQHLVEMTIPQKPTSRNQRYVKLKK